MIGVGERKYSEENLPQRQYIHHISQVDCSGIESEFPLWENGD
jgi:hypothetical protein